MEALTVDKDFQLIFMVNINYSKYIHPPTSNSGSHIL